MNAIKLLPRRFITKLSLTPVGLESFEKIENAEIFEKYKLEDANSNHFNFLNNQSHSKKENLKYQKNCGGAKKDLFIFCKEIEYWIEERFIEPAFILKHFILVPFL